MHTMDMVMTYGAVCLYKDMLLSCEKQVGITFVVLTASAHLALVDEGLEIFDATLQKKIN